MKLLTIIGARPQIIKAAAVSRVLQQPQYNTIEETLLHTGQHYDSNMSSVFFDELGIPAPHYNLGVGSNRHGEQTAQIISGIEDVLIREHFDGVLLYGDTNSTLAGAVATAKLQIPIFHVEAGLRSFNMTMPEEQNRIVCDHLSSICFAPTKTAVENLANEGLCSSPALFESGKQRRVVQSGDVMYDNCLFYVGLAALQCDILTHYNLQIGQYILATIHRNYNTDNPLRFTALFQSLLDIAERHDIAVALPLHPRTAKMLRTNLESHVQRRLNKSDHILLLPPVSYLEMIELERHALLVMTDSGGVQKEAFFFERPCIVLRPETEWVEIVQEGAGIVADTNPDLINDAFNQLADRRFHFPPLFGDGHAAEHIVNEIINYLS